MSEYAGPAQVLDALERTSAAVAARLGALQTLPAARLFCERLLAEHERLRAERAALRARLGLGPAATLPAQAGERSLQGLRDAQQELLDAHAEGLPALPDGSAVDRLARHLVVAARHLTLVDLWLEDEEARA